MISHKLTKLLNNMFLLGAANIEGQFIIWNFEYVTTESLTLEIVRFGGRLTLEIVRFGDPYPSRL